jgi:hypothetical protein
VSTQPEADELRIRSFLMQQQGVGPYARPPAPPEPPPGAPEPESEPRAWWAVDRPWAKTQKPEAPEDAPEPADQEEPEGRRPAFEPQPDYWPRPHMPAAVTRVPERAAAAISPKTRRLLYNASAAGAGWTLGLYRQFAAALADCGANYSISGALVLGTGGSLLIAHLWDRRTRHWWPGIAWAARIPLATAVLAVALWAPASAV